MRFAAIRLSEWISGAHWGREQDHLGLAYVVDGLPHDHRDYLAAGGTGFVLGDGALRYRSERIAETYYSFQLVPHVSLSPDFQFIRNPGYNADRGSARFASLRLHLDYLRGGGEISMSTKAPVKSWVKRAAHALGPGVTTGAADDDPSGVATYSIVGAQYGTSFLWSALITWPLMGCVQMMCARVGMVTGMGLAGALRQKFPRWIVAVISLALLVANTINIASDLSGMADAAQMLGAGPSSIYVWVFGLGICALTVRLRYHQIANVLKWLAVALFAYVITAFLVHPHWSTVLHDTVLPTLPKEPGAWGALVAILGTTISPYLFFWQAGQEVEEEKAKGRRMVIHRQGATRREINDRRLDVGIGTFFSNVVMFFIILTTALTLHAHGITTIATTKDAAEALRPLAGDYAYFLYTIGIVGTGLLAIPTLAGSAAYAFAETFDWAYGLDEKFKNAVSFYAVFIIAAVGGGVLDLLHIDPIKALYWSAIVNGVLAPFLLVALLLVSNDKRIMQGQPSSRVTRTVVIITTVVMFGAAVGMFVF